MSTEMLSPHFSLAEFTDSQTARRMGLSNQPASMEHLANLKRTAAVMEKVRTLLGDKPILISSGYRSPEVNRAVGGASASAHCEGLSCDFICPGFGSPTGIAKFLVPHMVELGIDQLIDEFPPNGWVHIGLSPITPRHMALTIDSNGTRTGIT
jgi:hypothetical protein